MAGPSSLFFFAHHPPPLAPRKDFMCDTSLLPVYPLMCQTPYFWESSGEITEWFWGSSVGASSWVHVDSFISCCVQECDSSSGADWVKWWSLVECMDSCIACCVQECDSSSGADWVKWWSLVECRDSCMACSGVDWVKWMSLWFSLSTVILHAACRSLMVGGHCGWVRW